MASGSINVNVRGLDPNGIPSPSTVQTSENKLKEHVQRVEVKLKDVKNPSNDDILNHVQNVLRTSSNAAKSLGANDTAEILDHATDVAERIPVAVAGIKREIQPVAESVDGLWSALERKGIVGNKERVNLKDLHRKRKKK